MLQTGRREEDELGTRERNRASEGARDVFLLEGEVEDSEEEGIALATTDDLGLGLLKLGRE